MPDHHDPVQHPAHYTSGERECIDLIRDELGTDGFIAYCRGNAIKYRHRAGKKGPAEEDEAKARWYTQMALHAAYPLVLRSDPRSSRPGFVPYRKP